MALENLAQWTRNQLSRFTSGDVPVTTSRALDRLDAGRVAAPALDLFENESELQLVVDVPGATPRNTHLTWNESDTLAVHVERAAAVPGTPWLAEYDELDWYREILLPPDVDGAKASSTVKDGVLTVRLPKRRTVSSKLIPVFAG